jgi:rhodanese-related sulfurtransferase
MFVLMSPFPLFGADAGKIKPKQQICQEAKAAARHISPTDLQSKIAANEELVLLDIRTRAEYDAGHIAHAIWLPRGFLEFKIESLVSDPKAEIVVYCLKSCRGSVAAITLQDMGYQNVSDLEGGLVSWLKGGLPLRNQYGEIEITDFSDQDPYVPVQD